MRSDEYPGGVEKRDYGELGMDMLELLAMEAFTAMIGGMISSHACVVHFP